MACIWKDAGMPFNPVNDFDEWIDTVNSKHATLIDCDNMGGKNWPLIRGIIPNESHIFGCGRPPTLLKWKNVMPSATYTPVHSGKNQADIQIAITAMQMLSKGIQHFLICSSDNDFKLIVRELKNNGAKVDRYYDKGGLRLEKNDGTIHSMDHMQQDYAPKEANRFETLAMYQSLTQNGALNEWVNLAKVAISFYNIIPKQFVAKISILKRLKSMECVELREIHPSAFEARLTSKPIFRVPAVSQ